LPISFHRFLTFVCLFSVLDLSGLQCDLSAIIRKLWQPSARSLRN
jgi:hypothetical protein